MVGPMARTIGDLKVLFEVLRGPDAGDALTSPVHTFDDTLFMLWQVRIGVLEDDGLGTVTPATQLAVRQRLLSFVAYRKDLFWSHSV